MPYPTFSSVAILGTGSWGTALAGLLAESCREVVLIGRDPEIVAEINHLRTNKRYLPELALPGNVSATLDYAAAGGHPLVLFVVPTAATRAAVEMLARQRLSNETVLLSCAKGIEVESGARMSEIIASHFPNNPLAVLSGPNHAEEVSAKLATCAVVGSASEELACALQDLLFRPYFRAYTSADVAGIELGGAIKNVYAIAAGIAQGLGLGDNAIAAVVTRGLLEMTRLGTALGGQPETFGGLSGVGDLMCTCYSRHSRNNRVGRALGQGAKLDDVVASLGMIAEGVINTRSVHSAATRAGVSTPLIDAVHAVLYEGKPAVHALRDLFQRDPRREMD
jgi:glycerol-3-phosphate dehydrogenase (NAD(P)+)